MGPFLSPRPDTQLEVPPLEMASLGGWLVPRICDTGRGGHGVVPAPSRGFRDGHVASGIRGSSPGKSRGESGSVNQELRLQVRFFWVTQGLGPRELLSFSARPWPVTPGCVADLCSQHCWSQLHLYSLVQVE